MNRHNRSRSTSRSNASTRSVKSHRNGVVRPVSRTGSFQDKSVASFPVSPVCSGQDCSDGSVTNQTNSEQSFTNNETKNSEKKYSFHKSSHSHTTESSLAAHSSERSHDNLENQTVITDENGNACPPMNVAQDPIRFEWNPSNSQEPSVIMESPSDQEEDMFDGNLGEQSNVSGDHFSCCGEHCQERSKTHPQTEPFLPCKYDGATHGKHDASSNSRISKIESQPQPCPCKGDGDFHTVPLYVDSTRGNYFHEDNKQHSECEKRPCNQFHTTTSVFRSASNSDESHESHEKISRQSEALRISRKRKLRKASPLLSEKKRISKRNSPSQRNSSFCRNIFKSVLNATVPMERKLKKSRREAVTQQDPDSLNSNLDSGSSGSVEEHLDYKDAMHCQPSFVFIKHAARIYIDSGKTFIGSNAKDTPICQPRDRGVSSNKPRYGYKTSKGKKYQSSVPHQSGRKNKYSVHGHNNSGQSRSTKDDSFWVRPVSNYLKSSSSSSCDEETPPRKNVICDFVSNLRRIWMGP